MCFLSLFSYRSLNLDRSTIRTIREKEEHSEKAARLLLSVQHELQQEKFQTTEAVQMRDRFKHGLAQANEVWFSSRLKLFRTAELLSLLTGHSNIA